MNKVQKTVIERMMATSHTRKSVNHTYTILETGDASVKLPPQAVEVLSILFEMDKKTVTEAEVTEAMEGSALKTKQQKMYIFKYYRSALIDAGFLLMD